MPLLGVVFIICRAVELQINCKDNLERRMFSLLYSENVQNCRFVRKSSEVGSLP